MSEVPTNAIGSTDVSSLNTRVIEQGELVRKLKADKVEKVRVKDLPYVNLSAG